MGPHERKALLVNDRCAARSHRESEWDDARNAQHLRRRQSRHPCSKSPQSADVANDWAVYVHGRKWADHAVTNQTQFFGNVNGAATMDRAMVSWHEWNGVLVADLSSECELCVNRKWWASVGWRPQIRRSA